MTNLEYQDSAKRKYDREYHQREDVKARRREREGTPEMQQHIKAIAKSYQKEYARRDYVKEKRRIYQRQYRARMKAAGGV